LRAAKSLAFDQERLACADECIKVLTISRIARGTQSRRALPDDLSTHLRHAGGWRALARAERKDMQMGKLAFLDDFQGILEHLVRFGREAGDDVCAKNDVGPKLAHVLA